MINLDWHNKRNRKKIGFKSYRKWLKGFEGNRISHSKLHGIAYYLTYEDNLHEKKKYKMADEKKLQTLIHNNFGKHVSELVDKCRNQRERKQLYKALGVEGKNWWFRHYLDITGVGWAGAYVNSESLVEDRQFTGLREVPYHIKIRKINKDMIEENRINYVTSIFTAFPLKKKISYFGKYYVTKLGGKEQLKSKVYIVHEKHYDLTVCGLSCCPKDKVVVRGRYERVIIDGIGLSFREYYFVIKRDVLPSA